MYVEHHILDAGAKLIIGAIENGVPTDAAGFNTEDQEVLEAVLTELNWSDLLAALRAAGERVPFVLGEG